MKKISAIVLALALVLMACVPFCASAASDKISFDTQATKNDDGSYTVEITYDASALEAEDFYLMDGGFFFEYDPAVMTLNVIKKVSPVSDLSGAIINEKYDDQEGKVFLTFAGVDGEDSVGALISMNFTLKDAETPAEYGIKLTVDGLKAQNPDDLSAGTVDLGAEFNEPVEIPDAIVVAAPTTTEAPADPTTTEAPADPTTTEAPADPTTAAPTTAAPTTAAPIPGGEATPWALMATVAVAGAALVVLSTKKSK